MSDYEQRKAAVIAACAKTRGRFRVRKGSSSNLFRYGPRQQRDATPISLADFNHVLNLDAEAATVETEGLVTYEQLVAHTLASGFLPTVSPELKHITVAGAIVGIGIESTCFRYGFVHDGLLEADVLLADGRVVTCRADNDYADLFTTLARAVGLPARTVVGLAYSSQSHTFSLHAWNEVAVDGWWHGVDPTWGQVRLDATHLQLPRERELTVLNSLKDLSFRVIEAQYQDASG